MVKSGKSHKEGDFVESVSFRKRNQTINSPDQHSTRKVLMSKLREKLRDREKRKGVEGFKGVECLGIGNGERADRGAP